MGSSASKTASSAAKTVAKATPRKYPTHPPRPSNRPDTQPLAEERERPSAPATAVRAAASEVTHSGNGADGADPNLAARLNQLGPVQPNSMRSDSSAFNESSTTPFQPSPSTPTQSIFPSAKPNAAVSLLTARYRLAEEAELEFSNVGRKGAEGRQFLDVTTIRQVLMLRDQKGVEASEIERRLGLKRGVVGRLGRRGVVAVSEES